MDPPFLNRFEKNIVTFDKLLDYSQLKLLENILSDDLNLKEIVS